MNGSFVALNIKVNDKMMFDCPIVYYWDNNETFEDMFCDKSLLNLFNKFYKEDWFNSSIFVTYTYFDSEDEIKYINKEFQIHEVIELPKTLENEFIYEVLDYLYFCAYKKHWDEDHDLNNIYKQIRFKYPKKITKEVVSNYITSKIREDYPEVPSYFIERIIKNFNDNINNELQ